MAQFWCPAQQKSPLHARWAGHCTSSTLTTYTSGVQQRQEYPRWLAGVSG